MYKWHYIKFVRLTLRILEEGWGAEGDDQNFQKNECFSLLSFKSALVKKFFEGEYGPHQPDGLYVKPPNEVNFNMHP
jgi:hypothetical protein